MLRFMIHAGMRSLPVAPQGGALGRGFGFLEMGIAAIPNKQKSFIEGRYCELPIDTGNVPPLLAGTLGCNVTARSGQSLSMSIPSSPEAPQFGVLMIWMVNLIISVVRAPKCEDDHGLDL